MAKALELYEAKWTQAARDEYHKTHPDNFAGPSGSFPIKDASDVKDAARLSGHAANPDAVKAKIISIAKRLGLSDALPDDWKSSTKETHEEEKPVQESTPPKRGKSRIATLKMCFLEDDAVSYNGRQYPREAVDKLIASGNARLNDPKGIPLTCFVSHGAADNDSTLHIVGKLTQLWRENHRAMASIDVPDTTAGRDMVSLVDNKYVLTPSLRASNAHIFVNPDKKVPQVGGDIQLEGIDFTHSPGIAIARVEEVNLAESQETTLQNITEVFSIPESTLLVESYEEEQTEHTTLVSPDVPTTSVQPTVTAPTEVKEDATPGVTSSDPQSDYAKRMMSPPPMKDGDMLSVPSSTMTMIHNSAASLLGMSCALKESHVTEAGKMLSQRNKNAIGRMHDTASQAMGMNCSYQNQSSDNEDDIDNIVDEEDQNPMDKKEATTQTEIQEQAAPKLTPEQAAQLLQEAGWTIQRPKTEIELLREEYEKRLAEQEEKQSQQFSELKDLLASLQTSKEQPKEEPKKEIEEKEMPQRKTLVEGSNLKEKARMKHYRNGDYIRERLDDTDLAMIADRSAPLPTDIKPEFLLKEFSTILFNQIVANTYIGG